MPATLSLDVIDIPRPCPADWAAMHGNDQVRFCDHCNLNVYNLSEMSRPQAEKLLIEKEGHLCVRLYRRMDGTVITRDCEGAWKLAMKKMSRLAALSCAAVISGLFAPFGLNDKTVLASGTNEASYPMEIARKWVQVLKSPPAPPPRVMAVAGGMRAPVAIQGDVAVAPTTQPAQCEIETLGKIAPMMGEVTAPTTQPTTQPVEKK